MRTLLLLIALSIPSTCSAQYGTLFQPQIIGARHPSSPFYYRQRYIRPYYGYGYAPRYSGWHDFNQFQQTWIMESTQAAHMLGQGH